MSLIHLDGFDEYSGASDPAMQYTMNGQFSTSAGRYGGGALNISGYNQTIQYVLPSPQTEIWLGFAMNNQETSSQQLVLALGSPSNTEGALWYQGNSGAWTFYRGQQDSSLGTATKAIMANSWHWIEVHYKIDPSAGVLELWIDGVQIMDLTGVDNSKTGGTSLTTLTFGGANNSQAAYYDDLYILNTSGSANNGRLGDSRIETLKPTSDAGPNNGTPSSGSTHYAMVDENQNDGSTSTITIANTSGQEELFGMGSLDGTPATVHAVKVTCIAEKTDGGSCSGEAVVSSSGTAAEGASTPLLTSFSLIGGIFETDPHTSAAWAYGAVNAMDCGFQIP